MSIGAGGILGATLMLGLALGPSAALAQASPQGAWTDPPARSVAPAASGPAAASPTAASSPAPVKEPATVSASRPAESQSTSRSVETKRTETASKASAPARVRQAAKPLRGPMREARRARPQVVAEVPRARIATPRLVERRDARPVVRRVVTRAYTPRTFAAAPPYPYAPLPVGRVVGPVDGERNPIFAEGDDRTRRIAAAQAAGYLVVRARSVQYPDGRMVRSYRPYDEEDGLD